MIEALAKDIKERGQLSPIVLQYGLHGHTVIDGKRRIKAIKKLKRKTIQAVFLGSNNVPPKRIKLSEIKGT